jgi:hypothetical protein
MTPALLSLAHGEGTEDRFLAGVLMARRINEAAGGTIVAPWEVNELPPEWIEAALALTGRLPELQKGLQKVEEHIKAWRKKVDGQNGRN